MTDSSDKQTMMCGSKLVKNACAHRRVSMRTTGHRNSKTHAHTGTVPVVVLVVAVVVVVVKVLSFVSGGFSTKRK